MFRTLSDSFFCHFSGGFESAVHQRRGFLRMRILDFHLRAVPRGSSGSKMFPSLRLSSRVGFAPDSHLIVIGVAAFKKCKSLVSIQLLKSVEILGRRCFGSCKKLESIGLESGSRLRTMADSVFKFDCLDVIYVPFSVAHVFLPVCPGQSLFASLVFDSVDHYVVPGRWTFTRQPLNTVVSSMVVFEDIESDLVPGPFGTDEYGSSDEFEIGYLQALEDILMNRVRVYSRVDDARNRVPRGSSGARGRFGWGRRSSPSPTPSVWRSPSPRVGITRNATWQPSRFGAPLG
jgi:hypothetical protein